MTQLLMLAALGFVVGGGAFLTGLATGYRIGLSERVTRSGASPEHVMRIVLSDN